MLKAYNIVTVLLNLEDINNGKYLGFVVVNISLTLKIVHVYNCSLDICNSRKWFKSECMLFEGVVCIEIK
jgi:hypothetical protein